MTKQANTQLKQLENCKKSNTMGSLSFTGKHSHMEDIGFLVHSPLITTLIAENGVTRKGIVGNGGT